VDFGLSNTYRKGKGKNMQTKSWKQHVDHRATQLLKWSRGRIDMKPF
jgi:hypothetical protein